MEAHTERSQDRPDTDDTMRRRAHGRRTADAAAAERMRQQHTWVDLQVQQAIARGDFDDLPGAGKPIPDLGRQPDPDWWLKSLIAREKITGVLPASLQLRKDDAALDDLVDAAASEAAARELIEDFNRRVIAARYSIPEGPPLITMPRDVEEMLARRCRRRTEQGPAPAPVDPPGKPSRLARLRRRGRRAR